MVIIYININSFNSTACNFAEDVFHIDEVTIYENKYSDNKYALGGDTLDAVSSIIFYNKLYSCIGVIGKDN